MTTQEIEQEFTIEVRVTSSAYKTIKAKSLKEAQKIARKQAREGTLTNELGNDIWEEIEEVHIAKSFTNGEPVGDCLSIDVSEIL